MKKISISTVTVKEKAELVVEMEKMAKVKDELTAEVDQLSSQLEQERSKVSALTEAKKTSVLLYFFYFCLGHSNRLLRFFCSLRVTRSDATFFSSQ